MVDLGEFLRPQLRLFLSADVQDSTAFKQQAEAERPYPWQNFFLGFFRDFPSQVERSFSARGLSVELWKLLGDEVVFCLELSSPAQAGHAVAAFIEALVIFQDDEQRKNPAKALRLKGAAWLAGFPVGNVIMPVTRAGERIDRDYIGPSMDAGFRLGKLATRRKFALSADLAWLILAACNRDLVLPLHYEGRSGLKGVMERDGYPFVWAGVLALDMKALVDAEEILRPPPRCEDGRLERFLEVFILKHGEPRHLPFILGSFDRRTAAEVTDYNVRLENIRAEFLRFYAERFADKTAEIGASAKDNAGNLAKEESEIISAIRQRGPAMQ